MVPTTTVNLSGREVVARVDIIKARGGCFAVLELDELHVILPGYNDDALSQLRLAADALLTAADKLSDALDAEALAEERKAVQS